MKAVLTLILGSINAFAFSSITPEDVKEALMAQKVVEVNKYEYTEGYIAERSPCRVAVTSRSARAYVVTIENADLLYVTPSGIEELIFCGPL